MGQWVKTHFVLWVLTHLNDIVHTLDNGLKPIAMICRQGRAFILAQPIYHKAE